MGARPYDLCLGPVYSVDVEDIHVHEVMNTVRGDLAAVLTRDQAVELIAAMQERVELLDELAKIRAEITYADKLRALIAAAEDAQEESMAALARELLKEYQIDVAWNADSGIGHQTIIDLAKERVHSKACKAIEDAGE